MEIKKMISALEVCADDEIICPACELYDKECDGTFDGPVFLMREAAKMLEAQQKRIAELETEKSRPLVEFLMPMDEYRGLKRKFLVFRSDTGERIENCFVLRPDKDPAAVEALRAYARVTDSKELSADIYNWVGAGKETSSWIPVTERLPESEKRVLLMTRYKGWNGKICRDVMCGFYEDGNVWCEDSKVYWDYEMKREENYDESRDDYRVPEGWFEELLNHIDEYNCVAIGEPVTHWMPLPEPPKEGE